MLMGVAIQIPPDGTILVKLASFFIGLVILSIGLGLTIVAVKNKKSISGYSDNARQGELTFKCQM